MVKQVIDINDYVIPISKIDAPRPLADVRFKFKTSVSTNPIMHSEECPKETLMSESAPVSSANNTVVETTKSSKVYTPKYGRDPVTGYALTKDGTPRKPRSKRAVTEPETTSNS